MEQADPTGLRNVFRGDGTVIIKSESARPQTKQLVIKDKDRTHCKCLCDILTSQQHLAQAIEIAFNDEEVSHHDNL